MDNIDAIQINFNQDNLFALNLSLAFLMFAVSLSIKVDDFKNVFKNPKLPIIGLISQLLLLPILTLGLILLFDPPASLALGMVLIGVCPGGNISNYAVFLAKANTALSVMLTAINTLGSVIITPLAFVFWANMLPKTAALTQEIAVEPIQMIQVIFTIIIIPLIIGMYLNHNYPDFVKKIDVFMRRSSMFLFISFVVVGILTNYNNIIDYVGLVFLIVLVYNTAALIMGYAFAKTWRLSDYDARAISIETGIQNTGLALILIFNFFDGRGGMALIAAWWGIWHIISSFLLATYWGKRPVEK